MYMSWGLKNKMFNQAHLHHHQGQNRPHQKTITYPQGAPPEPPQPHTKFLCGSEVLVRPSLCRLHTENIPAVEHMLYGQRHQYTCTAKDKQI